MIFTWTNLRDFLLIITRIIYVLIYLNNSVFFCKNIHAYVYTYFWLLDFVKLATKGQMRQIDANVLTLNPRLYCKIYLSPEKKILQSMSLELRDTLYNTCNIGYDECCKRVSPNISQAESTCIGNMAGLHGFT